MDPWLQDAGPLASIFNAIYNLSRLLKQVSDRLLPKPDDSGLGSEHKRLAKARWKHTQARRNYAKTRLKSNLTRRSPNPRLRERRRLSHKRVRR